MTTMIEQCARAMDEAARKWAAQWPNPLHAEDAPLTPADCPYSVMVRAVLETLKPATEGMIEAAHDRLAGDGDVGDIFCAMLNQALSDEDIKG